MSEQVEKRCTGLCGRLLPATFEFFNRAKGGKYGLQANCRDCQKARAKELYHTPDQTQKKQAYYQAHREQKLAYDKVRRQRDAEKISESRKKTYQKNREGILEQKRVYYQEKRELIWVRRSRPEVQAQEKAWYKEYSNRPGIRERWRAYDKERRSRPEVQEREHARRIAYWRSPERRERYRAWEKEYRTRPEWHTKRRAKDNARRARKRSVLGTHTPQQIQGLLKRQNHKCYYCSAKFHKEKGKYIYHIDHTFPLSRVTGTDIPANDISYLVLTCPHCNVSKGDKFPWEWPEGGRLF